MRQIIAILVFAAALAAPGFGQTAKTQAELLAYFADGQAAGSITPARMRDYVVSIIPATKTEGRLLRFGAANVVGLTTGLFEDTAGNIGLWNTSPLVGLDSARTARITGSPSAVITGTADPAASTTLPGTGTLFTTELIIGDRITINAETRTVTAIASATSLTVDTAFTDTAAAAVTRLRPIQVWRLSNETIAGVVNDLGNVGIGTTGPLGKLQVGNAGGADNSLILFAESGGGNAGSTLSWNMNVGGGNANSVLAAIKPTSYKTGINQNTLDFYVGGWNNNNDKGSVKVSILENGSVGIGTVSPTISGTGKLHVAGNTARPFDAVRTPATAAEACNIGEVAFDAAYAYFCVAANTWRRAAHASW